MPVSTRRTRTDNKGNVVSSILMHENGAFSDEKRVIEYDENDNVKSVRTVFETLVPGTADVVQKETLTEYEYTNIDGRYLASKITVDGRVQSENKYKSSYKAANGDTEYEAEATHFVYSDNPEITDPINVVSFRSTQVDPEGILIEGFDVASITREENAANIVDDVRHTYGSSDICCYHKNIVWGEVEGELRGSVVEMYWKELEDSTPMKRHFHEFNSYYTINKSGVEINEENSKMDDYTSDVYMDFKEDGLSTKISSIYRIVETESGLPFEFRTDFVDFYDDVIIDTMSINLTTGETITRNKNLQSDGSLIYQEYTKDNIHYYFEKEFEETEEGSYRLTDVVCEETNLETEKKTIRNEAYMYNEDGEVSMITYKFGDSEDYNISHSIYEYDETGHKCKNIITEDSIISKFYEDNREVFTVMNVGYPMCKSVFEFCYNRLLSSL